MYKMLGRIWKMCAPSAHWTNTLNEIFSLKCSLKIFAQVDNPTGQKKNERKWHIREKNSLAANICTHELKSRTMNVFVFIVVARTDSGICLIKSNKKANSVAFQDITTEIEGFRMRFSVLLPFPFYLWRYTNFMWRKLIHFIRRIDKRQVLSHFDWTKQVGNSNVMIEFSKSYSYVLG